MSTTETDSGVKPSTALDTRFVIATTLIDDSRRSRPQPHQHAGFGGFASIAEHGILRERHMHARLLHFRDRHHGSFQFAFERPAVIHVLGEVGDSEIGLVENLESDAPGLRQPRSGHLQAQLGDFVLGRQDLGSAAADFEIDASFAQLLHDRAGIFGRQARCTVAAFRSHAASAKTPSPRRPRR